MAQVYFSLTISGVVHNDYLKSAQSSKKNEKRERKGERREGTREFTSNGIRGMNMPSIIMREIERRDDNQVRS